MHCVQGDEWLAHVRRPSRLEEGETVLEAADRLADADRLHKRFRRQEPTFEVCALPGPS